MRKATGAATGKRARSVGWTRKTRAVFFGSLALDGDVRKAVAAAGLSYASAYALRRRDAAFADAWADAVQAACARMEDDLLALAIGAGDGERGDAFDPVLALKILARQEAKEGGRRTPAGPPPAPLAPIEEVERVLTRKLAALGKQGPERV